MDLFGLPASIPQIAMASHIIAEGKLVKARGGHGSHVSRLLVFRPDSENKLVGHVISPFEMTEDEREAMRRGLDA